MTKSHNPAREDVDLPTLGRALWRAKGWILGLALGAGFITFVALSMMRPLYTSEARILIQNDKSAFTRPAEDTRSRFCNSRCWTSRQCRARCRC